MGRLRGYFSMLVRDSTSACQHSPCTIGRPQKSTFAADASSLSQRQATRAAPGAFGGQDSDDSARGGDDDFNDNCEVPASEDAEMMGWDTYDDDYVGS